MSVQRAVCLLSCPSPETVAAVDFGPVLRVTQSPGHPSPEARNSHQVAWHLHPVLGPILTCVPAGLAKQQVTQLETDQLGPGGVREGPLTLTCTVPCPGLTCAHSSLAEQQR